MTMDRPPPLAPTPALPAQAVAADGFGSGLRAVSAGALTGLDILFRSVAFAMLAFAGPLAAGIDPAVVVFLAAGILGTLATLPLSGGASIPSAVQSAPLVILLPSLAATAAAAEAGLPVATATATAAAILGATALATGLCMAVLALLDAGRFMRLMPYPVTAGFLAAAGAVMIVAAVRLVLPDPLAALGAPGAVPAPQILTLGLAIALAVAMRAANRLRPGFGAVAALAGGVAAFFLGLAASGTDLATARALGLLSPAPTSPVPRLPDAGFWSGIDRELLWHSAPAMAAAVFLSSLALMLNLSGIELGLRQELRSRTALAGASAVNIVTGAFGGLVSYPSSTSTLIAAQLGGRSRLIAAGAIAVMALGIPLRNDIVAHTPPFATAGLLGFVGYEILARWFLDQRRLQSRADWSVIGVLVATTLVFGMLPAILIGIAASSIFFAASYARLAPIRAVADLSARRSAVDRGPNETRVLDHATSQVATLSLQGFLFFGSVDRIVKRVRDLLDSPSPPETVVLDFASVSGLDAAAVAAMHRLEHIAAARRTRVVLAGLHPEAAAALDRQGLALGARGPLSRAATADAALEQSENLLVARAGVSEVADDALTALAAATGDAAAATRLLAQMNREEVATGQTLITAGDPSGDIFLIDSGRLAVTARTADGRAIRLRSFRPGAIVGEMSAYLEMPRSADVIAEEASVIYRLSPERLNRLTREDPAAAALWHRVAARTLADKLRRTNDMLREAAP